MSYVSYNRVNKKKKKQPQLDGIANAITKLTTD